MAFLDIDDELNSSGDLALTTSKRFKAYNLLTHSYPETPEIGLDLSLLIDNGVNTNVTDSIINNYLNAFNCAPTDFTVASNRLNGTLKINLSYQGGQIEL